MPTITSDSQVLEIFRQALGALNESRIRYVVGGAFAVFHYTSAWRNTRDLDIYVEPRDVSSAMNVLTGEGFTDQGEMAEGDRDWILHASKNDALVDIIWEPPNHLREVDGTFYDRGVDGVLFDIPVRIIPVDELVFAKLFTLNHDRSDWPDIFRIVRFKSVDIDWQRLLINLGEHWQVLLSFIVLFDWTYPSQMGCIPDDIRSHLLHRKLEMPVVSDEPTREVVLDPWIYTRPIG